MWRSPTRGPGTHPFCLPLLLVCAAVLLSAPCPRPARAALSINTSNPADWVITNGTLKLDWVSTTGRVSGAYLNGVNLVDTTNRSAGLYMDNTGGFGGGTTAVGFHQDGNNSIDWWITFPAAGGNAYSFSEHFVLTNNTTGFSVYCAAAHAATDPSGGLGQIQYVYRISGSYFTNAYYNDLGLNNLGEYILPNPTTPAAAYSDPGRNVQNAVLDLHGLSEPAGWTRLFDTKYDRCSYQYLHKADGEFGNTYGVWTVLPSRESLPGGPTHQCLDAEGLLIMECLSGHLDNPLTFSAVSGVADSHLWGPFYFHFNRFNSSTLTTPADLYADAVAAGAAQKPLYDTDAVLLANGYAPTAQRGTVTPYVAGLGAVTPNAAWAVLSDPAVNTQLSCHGMQYWVNETSRGSAPITGVAPGTYRLSAYVLGQWGEMRNDSVTVNAGQNTALHGLTFVPENFSAAPPVWAIGTPDRSAHEFLHGHDASGREDREYQGAWNYWADLAANKGAVVYNATDGPGYKATGNPSAWYFLQWVNFNPGLFGGFYNAADDTTDGYRYTVPAYVAALETTAGSISSAPCPPWTVHFTTTPAQAAQGRYAVLSVATAAVEGDVIPSLNGHQLIWHAYYNSDADVRSGLSGYTQWGVFQWDASALNPPGQDNVLTLSVNRRSVLYDALRFEITNTTADPAVRGWHDYQYLYNRTEIYANDALPNP